MQDHTFSVLLTHYGDSYWVIKAIGSANLLNLESIKDVFVIDNNHGDSELNAWASQQHKVKILEYPPSGSGNAHHANALNSFLAEELIKTSHLIIMDSDLIVQSSNWIDNILEILDVAESCLALDPVSDYLTHPCFMVIPIEAASSLDFMEGMVSLKIDTGRTIGLQLSKLGFSTHLLKPEPGYGGKLGFSYLDGKLFHVTSISIRQQPTRRLGKSSFRISLAESWRRWILDSRLEKRSHFSYGLIFLFLRIFYAVKFGFLYLIRMIIFSGSARNLFQNPKDDQGFHNKEA